MSELQRLRVEHEAALLDFERVNRAYFAESISDRGDDFFEHFTEKHHASLADQDAGLCMFHVLIDDGGAVVGRFNLYDAQDGTANVGYRVAERVSGRGVATTALQELCRLARDDYGLRTLHAATTYENIGSQRVLTKAGFVVIGPTEVGGRHGVQYELVLARV